MELFPLLVIALIFVGIWGTMLVSARVKQISEGSAPPPDDRLLDEFREATRLLEARLERVEEELTFYKELRAPEVAKELPAPEED
jgi:hypothetical protein